MIRRIHHLAILVRNFDQMLEFYKEAFGFEVVGEEFKSGNTVDASSMTTVPRMVMLRAGNCFLEIIQVNDPHPNASSSTGSYVHFSVEVTDIDKEYERLKKLGVVFRNSAPIDYGHVKSVTGRDPEGNGIEIQQSTSEYDCNLDELLAERPTH